MSKAWRLSVPRKPSAKRYSANWKPTSARSAFQTTRRRSRRLRLTCWSGPKQKPRRGFCSGAGHESAEAPADVHTQPFAFRTSEEDDESVKMSNITNGLASTVTPALRAAYPPLKRAQNTSFYSIQISPFFSTPNCQLTEKKALPFFYSIQMKSHQTLITNHFSPKHGDSKWPKN